MNVARVLYPVQVLGPGKRLGIWLAGCQRRCRGCSNSELWEKQEQYEIPLDGLMKLLQPILQRADMDGIIITGGDPFFQAEELFLLLKALQSYTEDILVYTGYQMQEISKGTPAMRDCLKYIGVLIDGPYVAEENNGCHLRGSANQKIYYLKPKLQARYEAYMAAGPNRIQNFAVADGIVSVGIHTRNFQKELAEAARKRGVIIGE